MANVGSNSFVIGKDEMRDGRRQSCAALIGAAPD
jgi:hypothetical protein